MKISSPLEPDVAARRLSGAVTTGRDRRRAATRDPDAFVIIGRVRGNKVRVGATPAAVWNSWNTFLEGEIRPAEAGCVLEGRLGLVGWVRLQSVLAMLVPALVTLVGLLASAVRLVQREPLAPFPAVALVAAGIGVAGALGGAAAARLGSRGDNFLRRWLESELVTTPAHENGEPQDGAFGHGKFLA